MAILTKQQCVDLRHANELPRQPNLMMRTRLLQALDTIDKLRQLVADIEEWDLTREALGPYLSERIQEAQK